MANMTKSVAKAYSEQRQRLEYPLINNGKSWPVADVVPTGAHGIAPTTNADVLIEIGVEELPAEDLDSALAQLNEVAPKLFSELRLSHGGVKVYGTPRRLVIMASDVAPRQPDEDKVIKRPPANKA